MQNDHEKKNPSESNKIDALEFSQLPNVSLRGSPKPTFWEVLNWLTCVALIVLVVWAWYSGRFIHQEIRIIETCQGVPLDSFYNASQIGGFFP